MADLLTFGDIPLMTLVSPTLRTALRAATTGVRYSDGQMVHGRGDDSAGLSIVREGAVHFVKIARDGGETTVSIMGAGQSFGEATLYADMGRAYDAIAVGATIIDQITKPRFNQLIEDYPELSHVMLQSTTKRLYSVLEFLDDMRTLPLDKRVAKLLVGMLASAKAPDRVECTQHDIAYTLGVTRVSVGKVLAQLQADGLLQLGYGYISVPSADSLKDLVFRSSD